MSAGEKLAYTAKAGTLSLYDQNGERSAAIFYTAYTLRDAAAGTRPVTFAFNGGPGAASAYLHLGLVGRRRSISVCRATAPTRGCATIPTVGSRSPILS